MDKRFISKGGRLISDILEDQKFAINRKYRKAVDSVDHHFLINALKTFGFKKNLVRWIKMLLKKQESCIINGGITMKYFKLERDTRQGDPISVYLFILL